jgi:hypothetical protein
MRQNRRVPYIAGAFLLGALLVSSSLVKDQRSVIIATGPTLRVWSVDDRTLRIEVRNFSPEPIFMPNYSHIPPDDYPLNPHVEIKDGDRCLLWFPRETEIQGQLPLFWDDDYLREAQPGRNPYGGHVSAARAQDRITGRWPGTLVYGRGTLSEGRGLFTSVSCCTP